MKLEILPNILNFRQQHQNATAVIDDVDAGAASRSAGLSVFGSKLHPDVFGSLRKLKRKLKGHASKASRIWRICWELAWWTLVHVPLSFYRQILMTSARKDILDTEALLATSIYVDLNVFAALSYLVLRRT